MKKNKLNRKFHRINRARWVTITGVIMISLLSASCASEYKKQAENGGSEIGKSGGDPEVECRWMIPTGSTLRQKVCLKKEAWAEIDNSQKRDADQFYDDVVDEMRQNRTSFESDRE